MITEQQAAAVKRLFTAYPEHRLTKYRDWRACCSIAQHWIALLGLRDSPPLKILDLGGGLSYFGALCNELGHDATTLDLPEEFPEKVAETLGVRYIPHLLVACVPLPGDRTYDVITAIRLNMTEPERWGWDEYADFTDDVLSRLAPGGRWFMSPNRGDNVAFVLDADKWREILGERGTVRKPTPTTVLVTKAT